MNYVVEVRVFRHDERADLPLTPPSGQQRSTVLRFADLTNALRVAERACKPLREAQENGVTTRTEPVKPGRRPKVA